MTVVRWLRKGLPHPARPCQQNLENPMNPLPTLHTRGVAPEFEPVIVIDPREQTPLPIRRYPTINDTLESGDYSFAGGQQHLAIERKTIDDLVSCCGGENRGRFERELHRLRGFPFARLLVIGDRERIAEGHFRGRMNPASVLGSLNAWEVRYRVPVVFAPDPEAGARLVEDWVWWFARETILTVNALTRHSGEPREFDF